MKNKQASMRIDEYKLYERRWILAFEQYSAERLEPTGPTSRYSLRSAREHRLSNGRIIKMNANHRQVWSALVLRAYDLSQSVTHTWVGREVLSQEAGVSADMVGTVTRDFEDLGWISKAQRDSNSSVITIYLTPVLDKKNPPEPEPVSIAPEDMGHYVCQAAVRLRNEATKRVKPAKPESLPECFDQLTCITDFAFKDHKCSESASAKIAMTKALLECVKVAGSIHRCHSVLNYHFYPETPATHQILDLIKQSDDPAAYIKIGFPTWFLFYPGELPEIDPDDISA